MPKKFIPEILATITHSKVKSVIILDIENSQQFIPELFTLAPEAVYIASASRTQTYSLKKIKSLAEAMGVKLCSDLFSGQCPDKADKRLIEACKVISETAGDINVTAYTKDKAFLEELKGICKDLQIGDANSCYSLASSEVKRLSEINNPLIKRYLKRRKKHLNGK